VKDAVKKALVTLVLLVAVLQSGAVAQPPSSYSQNAVYFEGLGQGLLYSVNFDHRFTENIAFRVGFSSFSIGFISDVSITTIPIMAEFLTGHGSHHMEIGLGIVPVHGSISSDFFGTSEGSVGAWVVVWTATFGYRYQPAPEGFLFRIGLTPLFVPHGAQIWGGASIGYAF
jgi:hypothetical protein